ncbi:MAG: hypothetical protein QM235_02830 [Pseudomonadota bacterium]|jgi:hypothetical protein|nr:hypothetical protein [Pseudomonadota bacterium]
MLQKHGSPIEALGDDKKERVQGFKGSSGRVEKAEDWRVGGLEV